MRQFETGDLELAWAAGFYDGEGSISCTANNGIADTRVQLSIGQKNDPDSTTSQRLIRFRNAVGVGHIYPKTRIGLEINQSQFLISKASDVEHCIHQLWPHLSDVKRKQILTAISRFNAANKRYKINAPL